MSDILKRFEANKPINARVDTKGPDKTPIEADGGLDLSADETRLKQARGGVLNSKKYTDRVIAR